MGGGTIPFVPRSPPVFPGWGPQSSQSIAQPRVDDDCAGGQRLAEGIVRDRTFVKRLLGISLSRRMRSENECTRCSAACRP